MNRRQALVLVSVLALAACGRRGGGAEAAMAAEPRPSGFRGSRWNPRNWFGRSREGDGRPDLGPTSESTDNRPLVQQITAMAVERTSSGAIVRAEGLTAAAGYWDVDLVAENDGRPVDGVLTLRFVAAPPREAVPTPNDRARRVTAAYDIPFALLELLGGIEVVGETNSRRSGR